MRRYGLDSLMRVLGSSLLRLVSIWCLPLAVIAQPALGCIGRFGIVVCARVCARIARSWLCLHTLLQKQFLSG